MAALEDGLFALFAPEFMSKHQQVIWLASQYLKIIFSSPG